jgi:ABC-2 type transport system permease protein
VSEIHPGVSLGMTLVFMSVCLAAVWWIFRTGYKLKY